MSSEGSTATKLTESDLELTLKTEFHRLQSASMTERLRIGDHATEKEIKKAFRTLSKQYHPDRFANHALPTIKTFAQEIYLLLSDAERQLIKQARRSKQDNRQIKGSGFDASNPQSSAPQSATRTSAASNSHDNVNRVKIQMPVRVSSRSTPSLQRSASATSSATPSPKLSAPRAPGATQKSGSSDPRRSSSDPKRSSSASHSHIIGSGSSTDPEAAERDYQTGVLAIDECRYRDARNIFNFLLKRDAANVRYKAALHAVAGYLFKEDGKIDDAKREFKAACKLDSECSPALKGLKAIDDQHAGKTGLLSRFFKRT